MSLQLFLVAALLLPAQQESQFVSGLGHFSVRISATSEGDLATVRANDASALSVLAKLALESGRELQGLDAISDAGKVSIYLSERPLETALHWIAGAAGLRLELRRESVLVIDDTSPFPAEGELYDISETAFQRALVRYPDSPEGAQAEMIRADIQRSRGNLEAAIKHYDSVVGFHFDSDLTPDAMLESGRLLMEIGEPEAAAKRLESLATLEREHPYHALARLELADALTLAGEASKALYTIKALNKNYETVDPQELRARVLVQARATAASGDGVEALRLLDQIDPKQSAELDVMQVRATALEQADRVGEAAVAWMRLAEASTAELQVTAIQQAARLSLAADDELGTIFIHAWAKQRGIESAVLTEFNQARSALGLTPRSMLDLNDEQRIERAERLLLDRNYEECARSLEPLFRRRDRLEPKMLLSVALAYSSALNSHGLEQDAIMVLRITAGMLTDSKQREQIYLLASELHEKNGRIEDALDAIQGRL
jgi:hypothetical protein